MARRIFPGEQDSVWHYGPGMVPHGTFCPANIINVPITAAAWSFRGEQAGDPRP